MIDHAVTRVVIHGYACEATTRCGTKVKLWVPEEASSSSDLRWHVTKSPEFYAAGWVYKRGAHSSLTYCPLHANRALRCSCWKFGEVQHISDSCPQHSPRSTVRAAQLAVDARPEAFAKLLKLTVMATHDLGC